MSKTKIILSLVLLILLGGGVYLFMNLGDIAKRTIEAKATEALGVKVTIADLQIKLGEKKATVQKLRIANPKGFSAPYAVVVDDISVVLADISSQLVTLKDISVSGVNTYLDVTEKGTNLTTLKKGMKTKPAADTADAKPAPKVIIDRLSITNAQVSPNVVLFDQGGDVAPVAIPNLVLSDIGRKEKGVTIQEASKQIIDPFIKSASNAAGNAGLYQGLSTDALKDMGLGQFDKIKGEAGGITDTIGSGIKSIFGN